MQIIDQSSQSSAESLMTSLFTGSISLLWGIVANDDDDKVKIYMADLLLHKFPIANISFILVNQFLRSWLHNLGAAHLLSRGSSPRVCVKGKIPDLPMVFGHSFQQQQWLISEFNNTAIESGFHRNPLLEDFLIGLVRHTEYCINKISLALTAKVVFETAAINNIRAGRQNSTDVRNSFS